MSRKKSPPVKQQRAGGAAIRVAIAVALILLSALPFWQTLHFELVWDDPLLLGGVGSVAATGGVPALFASDFRVTPDTPLGYYRPVTTTSLWLQIRDAWGARGADVPPSTRRSLHLFNLVAHVVCTLLVWLLIRRFVPNEWIAGLGAALFAVHPAHVEPVAFISARTDLLVGVFVLGSLLCWVEALRATGSRLVAAVAVGALLALAGALAKEQALLLPVLLAVWTFLVPPAGRTDSRRGRLVLSAAWLLAIVVALVMRALVPGKGQALTPDLASFAREGFPSLLLYLKCWVLPWPASAYFTGYDLVVRWPVVLSLAVIVVFVVVAVRAGRACETLAALAITLVFLLPVLRLFPLAGAVAATRFLYLPSVGLALLVSLVVTAFQRSRASRIIAFAAMGVGIASCAVLSARGARPWATDAMLYTHMVDVSPHAAAARSGLAEVYTLAGRYRDAAQQCREAIRIDPNFADAYELLGVVSAKQGNTAEARQALETALRLAPGHASVHMNLGVLAAQEGKVDEAVALLRQATVIAPGSAEAHRRLGLALLLSRDVSGARAEAAILDRLDPVAAGDLRQRIRTAQQMNGE